MCVELRTEGLSLEAIAAQIRLRLSRSFTSAAVAYHLKPRAVVARRAGRLDSLDSIEVDRMCVELRAEGLSLKAIAARLQARFRRSFSSQVVAYHLKPRDARSRPIPGGVNDPPTGWLHIWTVRRVLGLTLNQVQAHISSRRRIRVRWKSPGPRYLWAEDVARVWPARWRRAVERTAARVEMLGKPRPSSAKAETTSIAPPVQRDIMVEVVEIDRDRPPFPVWRYSRYRSDVLYPRVVLVVDEILDERGIVDASDVLTRMRLLSLTDIERWRRGQVDCLENLLPSSQALAHATRVLGILRMHAIERGLVSERGVFLSEGDSPRTLLQFTYDDDVNIETAYRTRYVRPSLRSKPSLVRSRIVSRPRPSVKL